MSKKFGVGKMIKKSGEKEVVSNFLKTIIPAGMALPGPPLGPLLGQRGINIAAFCKDFNTRTSLYKEGIPLPCEITFTADRSYDLIINKPTPTYFVMQAAGIQRGAPAPGNGEVGKITIKHIYEIAKIKHEDRSLKLLPLRDICELLIGTCHTIGIKVVRDLDPKEYGSYLEEKRAQVAQELQEIQERLEAQLLRK